MQRPVEHQSSQTAGRRLGALLRSPWLAPLNDLDSLDELIAPFAGRFAFSRLLARVVAITVETADTRTFWLAPNRHWRGFQAGQHVPVSFEINGRRYTRSYSLSSDPADRRRIGITVKRHAGGRVSQALHEQLRVGNVISLSQASGDFTLPAALPAQLLMIGAGSGVTPMRSLLYALRRSGYSGDIVFVHVSRRHEDAIFGAELQQLAGAWPALRMVWLHTAQSGRPQLADLLAQVPDYRARQTLLCGPLRFMQPLQQHWKESGLSERLSWEQYGLFAEPQPGEQPRQVLCLASGTQFQAAAGEPLLVAAERAGLHPVYGCRKGLCRSCRSIKSGITRNLLTGEVCSESGVLVQLCLHAAESDVQLLEL
ncbi:MAG: ferredoxin reductase [Hydrocarboniphaga sp.]|uniref:ferredoxin reductase n=1 Tax=Hydrocarboniphaga sp. TaxID=2033016 RepID=UPI002603CB2C|nr:ferredoxin reductase [Hydrocarboniphaga sp.]MDB5967713.1 ferredoxin reductase [Hydrocarboniphaga sp.]